MEPKWNHCLASRKNLERQWGKKTENRLSRRVNSWDEYFRIQIMTAFGVVVLTDDEQQRNGQIKWNLDIKMINRNNEEIYRLEMLGLQNINEYEN